MTDPAGGGGDTRWVHASPHDTLLWLLTRRTSPRIAELIEEVGAKVPAAEALIADLFTLFYRFDVRWREASAPEVEHNEPVLRRIEGCAPYRRLHPEVAGDRDETLCVVDAFARSFADSLDKEFVEFLDAEAAYHDRKRALEAEEQALRNARSSRRKKTGDGPKRPEDLSAAERRERLEQLAEELERLEDEYRSDYQIVRARHDLRAHIDEGEELPDQLEEVARELAEFRDALAVWGSDPGDEQRLPLDQRLALFRRFLREPKLREATEILGRARFSANVAHRNRIPAGSLQSATIETGDDLARLVPSQVVWLSDEDLELEFYRRYAEAELLIRKVEQQDEPGRGPVIVLLDESGSMRDADPIAKGIALSLIGVARSDGRLGALVEFSAAGQLRVSEFPPGETDLTAVVDAMTHFFNGGTDFDIPIGAGLDIAERDARFATADLIIVTDGEATLHRDTVARLQAARETGARLFAVCVGVDDRAFRDVAERTWKHVDLFAERDGGQLLPGLVDAIHRPLPGRPGAPP